MASLKLYAVSTEYVYCRWTADVSLDSQDVEMAFLADDEDPDGDTSWTTAQWVGNKGGERSCRVLVGPDGGDVELEPGKYELYSRLHDSPEKPVRRSGTVTVV